MYTISGSGCRQVLCNWIKIIVGCVVGTAYLIEDTFTDTDNVTLPNHVPDTAPGGSSWAIPIGGGWKISGNKAVCPGANDQQVMIDSGAADVDVVLASVTLGAELGVFLRGSGAALNGWLLICSCARDAYEIYRMDGAYNLVASAAATLTPGDILTNLEFKASGTSIEALVNGVSKVSTTSAVYQAQTQIGLFAYADDGTAKWDGLTVAAL